MDLRTQELISLILSSERPSPMSPKVLDTSTRDSGITWNPRGSGSFSGQVVDMSGLVASPPPVLRSRERVKEWRYSSSLWRGWLGTGKSVSEPSHQLPIYNILFLDSLNHITILSDSYIDLPTKVTDGT